MAEGRPRAESEARSEIRSVIREANGEELGFDADPQPFHGFNDDSDDSDHDSLDDFTRCDDNGKAKAVEELDQMAFAAREEEEEASAAGNSRAANQEPRTFQPLQQIAEAPSVEEATPGVVYNKYKQAKFQTRPAQDGKAP